MSFIYEKPSLSELVESQSLDSAMQASDDIVEVYLQHFGVKGMKWGVRKEKFKADYNAIRNAQPKTLSLRSKNNEEVVVTTDRISPIQAFLGAASVKHRQRIADGHTLSISVGGTKVGVASIWKDPKDRDVMYLNWLGIRPEHRGKGYASTCFDAGISFAKSEGSRSMVLEVPGNSPDARHIYEKRGFIAGKTSGSVNDIWGGLTTMTLDLTSSAIQHSSADLEDLAFERALERHFLILYRGLDPFEFDPTPQERLRRAE